VNASQDSAPRRARLAEVEADLVRLRERYDQLMNAFKFDEARALVSAIQAAEAERTTLAETLPAPAPEEPRPYAVVARPRRRRAR
jgi:hypothetical protein